LRLVYFHYFRLAELTAILSKDGVAANVHLLNFRIPMLPKTFLQSKTRELTESTARLERSGT
jgi:hypothetical protein